jgi:hypothetical protein
MIDTHKAKRNRPSSAKVSNQEQIISTNKKLNEENINRNKSGRSSEENLNLSAEGLISPTISARIFQKRFSNDVKSPKLRQRGNVRNTTLAIRVDKVDKGEDLDASNSSSNTGNNLSVRNNDRGRSTSRTSTAIRKMEELMKFEEKFSIADEVSKRSKSMSRRPSSSGLNTQNKDQNDKSLSEVEGVYINIYKIVDMIGWLWGGGCGGNVTVETLKSQYKN